jgi:hypothetical protein
MNLVYECASLPATTLSGFILISQPALEIVFTTRLCQGWMILASKIPPNGNCSLQLSQTQEQRLTQVTSHEFAEMCTDPKFQAG